jgi:hypothetical protein
MVSFFAMGVAACFLGYMPSCVSIVLEGAQNLKKSCCFRFWAWARIGFVHFENRFLVAHPTQILRVFRLLQSISTAVLLKGLVRFIVQKGLVVSFPTINVTLSKRAFFQLFIQCGHRRGDLGTLQTFFGYRCCPLDPLLVSFVFCGLLQDWQCIAASSE